MKRSTIKWVALLLFALGVRGVLGQDSTQGAGSTGEAVEIKMTARKYRFDPNVITVKKGQHVRLIITALDRDHSAVNSEMSNFDFLQVEWPEVFEAATKAARRVLLCSANSGARRSLALQARRHTKTTVSGQPGVL